jgi:proteasome accessory factor B
LQRWLDLLAALVRRRSAASLEELAQDVPGYWSRLADHEAAPRRQVSALSRMFERDKLELRQLGVPLAVQRDERGNERLYRLERRDFFLPFLSCVLERGEVVGPGVRPSQPGVIAGLDAWQFTPDELAHVARAMHRVAQLGDGALAEAVAAAMRTLSHDLAPVFEPADRGETVVTPVVDSTVLTTLQSALAAQRPAVLDYHSIGRDDERRRQVEPLGLAFLSGHWYCIARDPDDGRVKQFRVARIRRATLVLSGEAVVPPEGFSLEHYAAPRRAWELGDGDATTVRVRVANEALERWVDGRPVHGNAAERELEVRRLEPFLRWLLTFAGDVRPVAPPQAVAAWTVMLQDALTSYGVASA